ncbi:MAG: NADP-dependent oxidoreductase [Anderseniella sp.]|nr:NADP-dependent oxidoreductase [Anderseniella sp.]
MAMNKVVKLARRPHGMVTRKDFEVVEEPQAELAEGEIRIATEYVSLDPAMRGWINDAKSYVPPVGLGETMRAFAAGTVVASRNSKFKEGDTVSGLIGAQSHAVSDGKGVVKADTSLAPLQTWVGGLGMPGLTAYLGLTYVGEPKEGETIVVSAASGAVGQVVGQIGKIYGCRTVGIAGGPDKCAALTREFGYDAAVDYKNGWLADDLKAACPNGIDVDFESVGGDILDTVLAQMNFRGRVAICGLISAYNATSPVPGPYNFRSVLVNRLRVQGFIVFDFIDKYPEAYEKLGSWHKEGKLTFKEDVREGGLEAFPDVLKMLYTGENFGKLILKV